jgi:hypothetical protein
MRGTWTLEIRLLIEAKGFKGQKGPGGRPLCHWCGQEVGPRKRRWCGEDCLSIWWGPRVWVAHHLPPECARCGLDTVAMEERRMNLIRRGAGLQVRRALRELGFDPDRSLWDADHILPLAEGGRDSPDNIQRLCQPCHREKTTEQAGRKSRRARGVMDLFLDRNPTSGG